MRKLIASLFAVSLLTASALAADVPANAPKPDYSTPKATVKTLYRAMLTGDLATAKACWMLPSPEAGTYLEQSLMPHIGPMMVRRAAVEKLGADKVTKLPDPNAKQPDGKTMLDGVMASIDSASVTEMGESAAVEIKEDNPNARPGATPQRKVILLKKVGTEWKVSNHPYAGTEAPPVPHRAAVAAQAKMFKDLTAEIAAGKYTTEDQIIAEWNKRAAEVQKLVPAQPGQPGQPAPAR